MIILKLVALCALFCAAPLLHAKTPDEIQQIPNTSDKSTVTLVKNMVLVMKFTFDWKEEVSGKVVIDAPSGRQAEAIFKDMNRQDLLKQAAELKSQGVEINFIDSRLSGMVTHKEWREDWRMSDEEWEQYENMVPEWA